MPDPPLPTQSPVGQTPESGDNSDKTNQNSSANTNGKHGINSKKFTFSLQEAFTKKMHSRDKYLNSISKKWTFNNCSMLSFDKSSNIKADQVFKGIKLALSEAEYSAIEAIGQYASTKNWTIQFNDATFFKSSLNKEIIVEDFTVLLKDANEYGASHEINKRVYKMSAFLRIHWLPSDFGMKDIEFYFKKNAKFLEVISIAKEKSLFDVKINNGIFKVKVEYEVKSHQSVLDFADLHVIDGLYALIQLSGMPPKCLYCKAFGHIRKNCTKSNSFCTSCNKKGHETSKCSMANRTAPNNQNLDQNFDEDIVADTVPSSSSNLNSNYELVDAILKDANFKVPEINPEQTVEAKKENTLFSGLGAKYASKANAQLDAKLAKKAAKEAQKKIAEDLQFEQAIADIEKKGFPRLEAIAEFEAMNAAARDALLHKFYVRPTRAAKRAPSSKVQSDKQKTSKTGDATENATDTDTSIYTDSEYEENGSTGKLGGNGSRQIHLS